MLSVCALVSLAEVHIGPQNIDVTNQDEINNLNRLLDVGLQHLAAQRVSLNEFTSENKPIYSLVKIESAQKQLVSGVSYHINVIIKDTNCDDESCGAETCVLTLWEKPWQNWINLTDFVCKKNAVRLGEEYIISNKDESALKALDFAVSQMNKLSNEKYYYLPIEIHQITKQIVNGIKYKLTFDFGGTKCDNNPMFTIFEHGSCEHESQDELRKCTAEVLYKPWGEIENDYELMNYNCE